MTDLLKGYVVTLEHDLRTDDAEAVTNAIRQIRGVLSVKPVLSNGIADAMARDRVRQELSEKLWKVLEK